MTNAMNKENKNVITGKQMVEYLVLVAISLISLNALSTVVIKLSTLLFSISGVNAVTLGGKVGFLVWLVFLGFISVKTIRESRS
ncbi:MAG: hypothetical protein J6U54_18145 [Clostridiales bacterium]|nr:hypothetical protein [Clostridiales bacterium]